MRKKLLKQNLIYKLFSSITGDPTSEVHEPIYRAGKVGIIR